MLPAVRKEWTEKLLRESTITDNFSLLASKENQVMAEVSFVDFLYQWLEHKYRTATGRAIDAKPIELSTYAGYEQQLNNPIAPYFREHPISLSALTKEDILAFYEKELERVKPSTVKHYHALIHGALNYAVDKKLILPTESSFPSLKPSKGTTPWIPKSYACLRLSRGTRLS